MTHGSAEEEALPAAWSVGRRWSIARGVAGHAAALTMSLYLTVKIIWVVAALLGHGPEDVGSTGWVLLNTLTVGMSAIGVVLGLALAQRWGRRLPGGPLILFSWVAAASWSRCSRTWQSAVCWAPRGRSGRRTDRQRRARARVGDGPHRHRLRRDGGGTGRGTSDLPEGPMADGLPRPCRWGRARSSALASPAVTVTAVLGLLWLYWAFGGTFGLDPAHRDRWDLNGRMLNGSSGPWALLGAWSVGRSPSPPRSVPRWVPMTLAFAASGSLFAWSAWKLPMAVIRPGDYVPAEYFVVAILQHTLSIGGGLAILAAVLPAALHRAVVSDASGPVGSLS